MYTISCESTVDLNLKHLNSRNIPAIAYTYTIDGQEYEDDMREGNGLAVFYNKLATGKYSSTSLINVERYVGFFRPLLAKGDLLHVVFSSALSNSVKNALNAAEQLKEEFPERKIYVLDSTCACVGLGIFVDCLADLRDNGKTLDEVYQWALTNRTKVQHLFYSTTLKYFRKSGRVSAIGSLVGNLLHICPVMHTNIKGNIVPIARCMSEKKAISRLLEEIAKTIDNGSEYCGKLWLGHSDYISAANNVVNSLKAAYPKADVRLFDIGPVIASHCGPGTISVYYWGEERQA